MNGMQFYTYAYIRSKDSKTAKAGTPYYIGKGKGSRAYNNHGNVYTPTDARYIVILEDNLTELGAFALERRYIEWFGRLDLGTGILYNKTNGGEGTSGFIPSRMTRQKLSESKSGKKNHCFGKHGESHPAFGHKKSAEFKDQCSKRFSGEGNPMYSIDRDKHPCTKIKNDTALTIINSYKTTNYSIEDLSTLYNVSYVTIKRILRRNMTVEERNEIVAIRRITNPRRRK